MDNETRRSAAEAALLVHANAKGYCPGSSEEEKVCDLIADLIHYCDAQGVDALRCIEMAWIHRNEEVREESAAAAAAP